MPLKKTKEQFVADAIKVHGDKYDYSKVEYVNNRTKVCIICPEHGEFWQIPDSHLRGRGCSFCRYIKSSSKCRMNLETFIQRSKEVHGNKYDYSKVEYINTDTKVCIVCPKHGEFWQTPHHHLRGRGCYICGINKKSNKEFIQQAIEIHGDKYDYTQTNYVNKHHKVKIICPVHGDFWQLPNNHLNGRGCPQCGNKKSQKEEMVLKSLQENFYNVIYQYTNKTFLKGKNERKNLTLDFYLPDYNIGIEYQGEQHFVALEHFGGEETYITVVERDERKYKQCTEHGIKIFYISMGRYVPDTYFATVYTDIDSLIKAIKEEIVDDK